MVVSKAVTPFTPALTIRQPVITPRFGVCVAECADIFTGGKYREFGEAPDLQSNLDIAPPKTRRILDRMMEQLSEDELKAYEASPKHGLLPECADLLYEYTIFQAIEQSILTPELITELAEQVFIPMQANGESFVKTGHAIANHLKPWQYQAFHQITGLDIKLSNRLLALAAFKFTINRARPEQPDRPVEKDIRAETLKYLLSEATELGEELGMPEWRQKLLASYAKLFTHLPNVSFERFSQIPLLLTGQALGKPLPASKFLEFAALKHLTRQEFDYSMLGDDVYKAYNARKHFFRPNEAIYEAFWLKNNGIQP